MSILRSRFLLSYTLPSISWVMKHPWVEQSFPFLLGGDEHTCVQHSSSFRGEDEHFWIKYFFSLYPEEG